MPTFRSDELDLFFLDVAPLDQAGQPPILLIHGFASNHAVNWINTLWVKTLSEAGRRVVLLDNRGHGASGKPHEPARYAISHMVADAIRLLDHLGIGRADVMGYSMGARITAHLAHAAPDRVRAAILGGLGYHLVDGAGLPQSVATALEAPTLADVSDPSGRMFRRFAESTGSDLVALAACIRGSRQAMTPDALGKIECPVLVAVGTTDVIAGNATRLAALLPNGSVLDIPGRDHNLAVGDRAFKAGVLAFLDALPRWASNVPA